jgi:hypothetical protein
MTLTILLAAAVLGTGPAKPAPDASVSGNRSSRSLRLKSTVGRLTIERHGALLHFSDFPWGDSESGKGHINVTIRDETKQLVKTTTLRPREIEGRAGNYVPWVPARAIVRSFVERGMGKPLADDDSVLDLSDELAVEHQDAKGPPVRAAPEASIDDLLERSAQRLR